MPSQRRKIVVLFGFAGLIAISLVAYVLVVRLQKPLFFDTFGTQHDFAILPSWHANRPMMDRRGAFAYADYGHNMFVVIVTGQQIGSHVLPDSTSNSATFLRDSAFETTIELQPDRLILISKADRVEFNIEPRTAKEWHSELHAIDGVRNADLLREVVNRYKLTQANEEERELLNKFCNRVESAQ
jgi:hypothetical protein